MDRLIWTYFIINKIIFIIIIFIIIYYIVAFPEPKLYKVEKVL
jgi:uncharacterized SAM-binding protein YcdF (DUF218 family)